MTKSDLVHRLSKKLNYRLEDTEAFIDGLGEFMIEAAQNGESLSIPSVFKMEIHERAARKGYDCVHGLKTEFPSRHVVVIKTGSALKAIGSDVAQ